MADATPLLEARQISKAFPGVQALQNVNLRLDKGQLLAVCGENGAGKSTLMKILAGVQPPDSGSLHLDGQEVRFKSVDDAQRRGIVLIHQELNLAENLTVAGNIFLGREPTRGGFLRLIDSRIDAEAEAITRRLGLECSPRTRVGDLSVGQQQLVEIARALSLRSRIIIMDEPTSSLTQRETEKLFEVIADLKQAGISILYISHRLKEIEEIADRVTVFRDGKNAGELERAEINHEAMVRLMVGRELKQFFQRNRPPSPPGSAGGAPGATGLGVRGEVLSTGSSPTPPHPQPLSPEAGERGAKAPLLEVSGLRFEAKQRPIDLRIQAGEIVGMAGLMGAGRTELAEALFGIRPILAGSVAMSGQPLQLRSPRDAIGAGIYLVPEDRRSQGLLLAQTIRDNITLPSLRRLSRLGIVETSKERELATAMCSQLNVRAPGIGQVVGLLSGGNQQKVVLGKWLGRSPRLLILDEPTRGIDVGAKTEIYGLMDSLAQQGIGVLMISSDLEEILGMSDRVLVMHEGNLAGELARAELSEEAIMRLATGGHGS